MIYIELNEKEEISFIHYVPFDVEMGMGKTKEELEVTGYLVDEMPVIEEKPGYEGIHRFDKELKEIYVDYVEIPKSEMELLQDQVLRQEKAIAELTQLVSFSMMP